MQLSSQPHLCRQLHLWRPPQPDCMFMLLNVFCCCAERLVGLTVVRACCLRPAKYSGINLHIKNPFKNHPTYLSSYFGFKIHSIHSPTDTSQCSSRQCSHHHSPITALSVEALTPVEVAPPVVFPATDPEIASLCCCTKQQSISPDMNLF